MFHLKCFPAAYPGCREDGIRLETGPKINLWSSSQFQLRDDICIFRVDEDPVRATPKMTEVSESCGAGEANFEDVSLRGGG